MWEGTPRPPVGTNRPCRPTLATRLSPVEDLDDGIPERHRRCLLWYGYPHGSSGTPARGGDGGRNPTVIWLGRVAAAVTRAGCRKARQWFGLLRVEHRHIAEPGHTRRVDIARGAGSYW